MQRRLVLLLALAAALPACHNSSSVASGVAASQLSISVAPNPLVTVQSSLTGPTFTIKFTTTVKEAAGLGATIQSISANLFDDATGALIAQTVYDDKDLVVFIGSNRVEAKGELAILQEVSYVALTKRTGSLTVTLHAKDDKGNAFQLAVLVKAT
jgi:hypothetical protein